MKPSQKRCSRRRNTSSTSQRCSRSSAVWKPTSAASSGVSTSMCSPSAACPCRVAVAASCTSPFKRATCGSSGSSSASTSTHSRSSTTRLNAVDAPTTESDTMRCCSGCAASWRSSMPTSSTNHSLASHAVLACTHCERRLASPSPSASVEADRHRLCHPSPCAAPLPPWASRALHPSPTPSRSHGMRARSPSAPSSPMPSSRSSVAAPELVLVLSKLARAVNATSFADAASAAFVAAESALAAASSHGMPSADKAAAASKSRSAISCEAATSSPCDAIRSCSSVESMR
mmetsp:Transcript_9342/g.21688  ORF Transcript_9342/g.21688 Transcript_9342/m.21688 type:complete len:289 (-) Transcript_9342:1600-2466(-)